MKVMNTGLVRLARRIDGLWRFLAFTRQLWHPPHPDAAPGEPLAILVLELHLIGDAVMLLPFLEALRRRNPTARITVVAGPWNNPVFANEPSLDSIIEFTAPWVKGQGVWASWLAVRTLVRKLRGQRWDIGIDMRGDIRNLLILIFARCVKRVGFDFTGGARLLTSVVPDNGSLDSLLGHHERLAHSMDAFDGKPFVPQLRLNTEEYSRAQGILNFVGFHFGASLPLRRLPLEDAATLIRQCLAVYDGRAIIFDAPGLESYVAELMVQLQDDVRARIDVWRGDLRSFIVISTRASVMYTMDSGPAHIAAATGCPTVVLFGPNRAALTSPRGAHVQCVELDLPLPCQPCDQRRCIHPGTRQACLKGLASEAVEAGLRLRSTGTPHPDSKQMHRMHRSRMSNP
jgi:ADP-heptose:LPS heptosyltransferase